MVRVHFVGVELVEEGLLGVGQGVSHNLVVGLLEGGVDGGEGAGLGTAASNMLNARYSYFHLVHDLFRPTKNRLTYFIPL